MSTERTWRAACRDQGGRHRATVVTVTDERAIAMRTPPGETALFKTAAELSSLRDAIREAETVLVRELLGDDRRKAVWEAPAAPAPEEDPGVPS